MKKVFSIILTVFLVIHLIAPVFAANVNAKPDISLWKNMIIVPKKPQSSEPT